MDSLKTKQEFDFVYRRGFSRYAKGFTLYVCKISSLLGSHTNTHLYRDHDSPKQPSKLGLSVSRKVGNAVVRNRLKRRVRAICSANEQIAYGLCLVFVAKPGVADLSFAELQDSLHKTLAFILQHLHKAKAKPSQAPRTQAMHSPADKAMSHSISNHSKDSMCVAQCSRETAHKPTNAYAKIHNQSNLARFCDVI